MPVTFRDYILETLATHTHTAETVVEAAAEADVKRKPQKLDESSSSTAGNGAGGKRKTRKLEEEDMEVPRR